MKIAVSSTGPGLEDEMDPRFGRCDYFVMVDGDSMDSEAVENPNVMAAGGAGIQSAQLVAGKGAEVVLTGHCGPNAFQTLEAAGIPVCVGVRGTVRDAVDLYKKGDLSPAGGPNAASKSGTAAGNPGGGNPGIGGNPMGPGMGGGRGGGMGGGRGGGMGGGRGAGMGGGRGAGMGVGRGAGMGWGMGRWSARCRGWGFSAEDFGPAGAGAGMDPLAAPESDLSLLKSQARELGTQLDRIRQRIEEIEKSEGQ